MLSPCRTNRVPSRDRLLQLRPQRRVLPQQRTPLLPLRLSPPDSAH
ncbi:hypothetical protein TREPR_3140 [Treponema primitia ZAS-2]|uniref:Uncharacterized protein n=1 Tax=Treponema primitia (strain ATCC BAA-887 / DSM 12427 / ZAS-2) TaxID=545694 RepID=F5YLT9_TREPZ|nr:hypothetical protein TREPR_3140 [Treponema primitia ZAS-2]